MENNQTFSEEEKTRKIDKLKRFDDVFRMLLIVITVTISIGLNTYSELNLLPALGCFLISLGLWMSAHLTGSNQFLSSSEIVLKLYAWTIALLVAAVVFAKFILRVSTLDPIIKILVECVTLFFTLMVYWWFGELIPSSERRKFKITIIILIFAFYGWGYINL